MHEEKGGHGLSRCLR